MSSNTSYMEPKSRFLILDALRGVAAIVVVWYHLMEHYFNDPATQFVNHGYLAVDFFFILSGYVIGYAYDDRWKSMTTWGFFKRRIVRLQPMVIIGTLMGACLFLLRMGPDTTYEASSWWKFALCLLFGCLMIPQDSKIGIPGQDVTNAYDDPTWSLTYEYVANILYAFFFRRLPKWGLAACLAIAAFFTLNLGLRWDVFNNLEPFDWARYTFIGGWAWDGPNFFVGMTRVLFPFICGLLLARCNAKISLRGGVWICMASLLAIFLLPCIGGADNIANGIFNCSCIIVLFPLIIMAGAGTQLKEGLTTRTCKFLGEISYPLYLSHIPFVYLQISWLKYHADAPMWQHAAVCVGVFLFSVFLAYAVMKTYDIPVRKWLTEHWLKKNQK